MAIENTEKKGPSPKELLLLVEKHEAFRNIAKIFAGGDPHPQAVLVLAGIASVLFGNPQQDIYEYDLFDPMRKDCAETGKQLTGIFDDMEKSLGISLLTKSKWAPQRDISEAFRIITYGTRLPDIQINHIEYQDPQNPQWGTTVRREIWRVAPAER